MIIKVIVITTTFHILSDPDCMFLKYNDTKVKYRYINKYFLTYILTLLLILRSLKMWKEYTSSKEVISFFFFFVVPCMIHA